MTTRCALCVEVIYMVDHHWPTTEIVDYMGMDTPTLGRHLRNHGHTGAATTIDPRQAAYVQAPLCPGVGYAAVRTRPRHDNTCPDQCWCEGAILAKDNG